MTPGGTINPGGAGERLSIIPSPNWGSRGCRGWRGNRAGMGKAWRMSLDEGWMKGEEGG